METGMKLGMSLTMIIFLITILIFIGAFIMIFNPKLRDKLFGEHTELTAKRIKKGFMDAGKIYCKHCGANHVVKNNNYFKFTVIVNFFNENKKLI